MGVIGNKIEELRKHISNLNKCEICLCSDNYDIIINEAEEISKLAYFLKSYKELDKERQKDVNETIQVWLDEHDTYDRVLFECIGYCFGEKD